MAEAVTDSIVSTPRDTTAAVLTRQTPNTKTGSLEISPPLDTTTSVSVKQAPGITTGILNITPPAKWSISFGKVFWALIVFLLALFIIRYTTRLLEAISERWANLRLGIKRFIPIFRIFGWFFVIYIEIAWIFSPPIETLIAVTASTGIAIGFASQDILKNIFGGVMILFDKPFQIGDKIEVGKYYGEVVNIGLRTVRIVTPDDSLVSIPNSEIVNQSVSNSNSGESNCQVVAELFLPASIDIEKTRKIAIQAAAVSRFAYLKKPIAVILKNEIYQGRSMIKLRLKAYVLDLRYEFPFMSDMTESVIRELHANGIVDQNELIMGELSNKDD
ncbi:mechanosensitive ion channel family protein [bacterium]|nr:mechanosensitive ion channel family protein [bacterium]